MSKVRVKYEGSTSKVKNKVRVQYVGEALIEGLNNDLEARCVL